MKATRRAWYAQYLLVVGAVAALMATGWGCFACVMFNPHKMDELCAMLVLVLPLPCYLLNFYSKRIAVSALWVLFLAFWALRMFAFQRTPAFINPLDLIGCCYAAPLVFAQLSLWLTPAGQSTS